MASPPIQLQFFGVFGIHVEGVEVKALPRPAQELLVRLAQAGSRGVDRVAIAADLWPNADAERAQFYLRRCLMQTRALLGPQRSRLEASDDRRVGLDLADCRCDLLEFDAAARLPDAKSLGAAAERYTGELMIGHRSEGVRHMREHYREQYVTLLCRLSHLALEAGDPDASLEWIAKAKAADPLREETYRQVMRLLREQGDFAGVARTYRDLRLILRRTLGLSPSRETTELYNKLLADARLVAPGRSDEVVRTGTSGSGLPTPTGQFIGRESELALLTAKVDESRMVTLTGLGGVGKSRLAIQCAISMTDRFPSGIRFANMSVCGGPEDVADQIACALGIFDIRDTGRLSGSASGRTLLILDEVEQVAGECARVLAELLKACPGLHVLCTSRVALQTADENVVALEPMALPLPGGRDANDLSAEAVTFFLACAARVAPAFRVGPENQEQVIELCRRLDGLPLALELAAVRLRTLPIREIVRNLDDRFRLLNISAGGLPRPRTLEGVLDWSFQLLSPLEQSLFVRLGVFPSTWTVAAAESICADSRVDIKQIPSALSSLVDHSLISYDPGRGMGAYRMLETVRSYARDRLSEQPEVSTGLGSRHADHYFEAAGALGDSGTAPDGFLADQANYSTAIEYFLTCGDEELKPRALILVNRLFPHWYRTSMVSDGLRTALNVIEAFENRESGALTETLFRAAGAAHWLYKLDLANELFARAEAMADALGFDAWSAESLRGRGELASDEGRLEEAAQLLGSAVERFRTARDPIGEANCLGALGYVARQRGDLELARKLTEEALAIHIRSGFVEGRLWCMGSLAAIHLAAKTPELAAPLFLETLTHQEEIDNHEGQAWNLTMLGITYMQMGDYAVAESYLNRALHLSGLDAEDLRKAWPTNELGEVHRRAGQWEKAEATLREALDLSRAGGSTYLETRALLRLGAVEVDRGNLVAARAYQTAAAHLISAMEGQDLNDELHALAERIVENSHPL